MICVPSLIQYFQIIRSVPEHTTAGIRPDTRKITVNRMAPPRITAPCRRRPIPARRTMTDQRDTPATVSTKTILSVPFLRFFLCS